MFLDMQSERSEVNRSEVNRTERVVVKKQSDNRAISSVYMLQSSLD